MVIRPWSAPPRACSLASPFAPPQHSAHKSRVLTATVSLDNLATTSPFPTSGTRRTASRFPRPPPAASSLPSFFPLLPRQSPRLLVLRAPAFLVPPLLEGLLLLDLLQAALRDSLLDNFLLTPLLADDVRHAQA